jgi:hypothetical protein
MPPSFRASSNRFWIVLHYHRSLQTVLEPEKSVRKVCEFLGIEFNSAMLNPPKIGSSYAREEGTGFDQRTLDRWQEYLKPWMSAWLLVWSNRYIKVFGYIR